MKLLLATRNESKKKELLAMLQGLPYDVVTLEDLKDNFDVIEDGSTFLENAMKKASTFYHRHHLITIADDSGLVVEALHGAPGVYSARYAGIHGNDLLNNQKLLQTMKHIKNRKAKFVCSIVLYFGSDEFYHFKGEMHGSIGHKLMGSNGFGYDPLFVIDGLDQTSAELEPSVKNNISHRAKAMQQLYTYLKERQK
ncbi:MAG TPA: RdgB/HAM1 family non-canonical purine NTP pyrophosphatase [Bacilli bacterium]|nr:RdgB/HAM1 family non-canonical purine NTP pyrophosphatase [Bacilli bacterium]